MVCRLSNPQDDVISLWINVQPDCWRCSPSRRRTLLPTSSSSTKSDKPASPFDDVWTTRSVTGTKNSRGSMFTMSRRHDRIVLSREFLVGIVAVDPTRTSIICINTNFALFYFVFLTRSSAMTGIPLDLSKNVMTYLLTYWSHRLKVTADR